MAKPTSASPEDGVALEGSISATGATDPVRIGGEFNLSLSAGAAAGGTVRLQRSFDAGTNWYDCTDQGSPIDITVPASGSISEVIEEPESSVLYRLNCTAFTAVFSYRFSR